MSPSFSARPSSASLAYSASVSTVSHVAAGSGEVLATGSGVGVVAVGAGVAPVVGAEEAGEGAAVQPANRVTARAAVAMPPSVRRRVMMRSLGSAS